MTTKTAQQTQDFTTLKTVACAISLGSKVITEMLCNSIDKPTEDNNLTNLVATAFLGKFSV